MTNLAATMGLQLADTNLALTTVLIRDPISLTAVAWLTAIGIMPLTSAACYFLARSARRMGKRTDWQLQTILLAAIFTIITTLMVTSTTIHDVLESTMRHDWGAADAALLRINIAHACEIFRLGALVTGICLAFAVVCPRSRA